MLCSINIIRVFILPLVKLRSRWFHRLELATVDRPRRLRDQVPATAQHDELATHVPNGDRVLGTEVGQRLEVRSQAPDQPHQLEVATRFLLEPARRLDAVEVPVEVDLEHRRRVIGRAARCLGLDALEAERRQIERAHKRIDHSDGVLPADVLVNRLW